MDLVKLHSTNPDVVRTYVLKKFKIFKGYTYSHKSRVAKCEAYYMASKGSQHGQDIIEEVYQQIFGQLFDPDAANERSERAAAKKPEKLKIESGEWLRRQELQHDDIESVLGRLRDWKSSGKYQEGESFFALLKTTVESIDPSLCNQSQFRSEFSAQCRASVTSGLLLTPEEVKAEFELLVGFEQTAQCTFEAHTANWGDINTKLEQSFKAGVWAKGEAGARLTRLGFSAEVQAAIAIGAQLNVAGEFSWSKGGAQLRLGGTGEMFAGAKGNISGKLSVKALQGLEAAFEIEAFFGFKATTSGTCSFAYEGQEIAAVTATAGVSFGIGGKLSAEINAPIFGPTKFSFDSNVSFGLGVSAGVEVKIDFKEAALAGSSAFKQVVYWRTMAQGYEMTLMKSDAKNLYYLNKAIARLQDELEGAASTIDTFNKVPMEKRSLLVAI